jgi:hypothetical protein
MSRLLIGLSIIQTLAIGVVAMRVMAIDARLNDSEDAVATGPGAIAAPPPSEQTFIPANAVIAEATPATPDTEMLRRIIREEFAMLRLGAGATGAQSPVVDPAPDPKRAAAARRDLDRYISRGRIEPNEMELYLDKIAELPAAERTEALRALTKAMNDGRIEGRF